MSQHHGFSAHPVHLVDWIFSSPIMSMLAPILPTHVVDTARIASVASPVPRTGGPQRQKHVVSFGAMLLICSSDVDSDSIPRLMGLP